MSKHLLAAALLAGTALVTPALAVPEYDHIVIVTMENHSLAQVINNPNAPTAFINQLLQKGMLLVNSHGDDHPSEPNYNFQISGQPQGVGSIFANGGGAGQVPTSGIPAVTNQHLPQGGSSAVQTTNLSPVLNATTAPCASPATCV